MIRDPKRLKRSPKVEPPTKEQIVNNNLNELYKLWEHQLAKGGDALRMAIKTCMLKAVTQAYQYGEYDGAGIM